MYYLWNGMVETDDHRQISVEEALANYRGKAIRANASGLMAQMGGGNRRGVVSEEFFASVGADRWGTAAAHASALAADPNIAPDIRAGWAAEADRCRAGRDEALART